MNTLQVRKETISIIKKLKGGYARSRSHLAFQEGNAVNIYPFLCLTGPCGSGKSMGAAQPVLLLPMQQLDHALRALGAHLDAQGYSVFFLA